MDTIFPTRTHTETIHGHHDNDIVDKVVSDLIDASQWFAVEPCPDDRWAITVKKEYQERLSEILGDHRWSCCGMPTADNMGETITNYKGECPFCDVAS